MSRPTQTAVTRRELLARLFPQGIPSLWCPLITHYDPDGAIDAARIAAHLRHLAPCIKGFLIPGSTGDGWELNDDEIRRLLEIALEQASALDLHLLIGVLKTDTAEAARVIADTVDWLQTRTTSDNTEAGLIALRVSGFTVCPPRGKDLSQEKIGEALATILRLGLATALYQLPQITLNEMNPDLVTALARQFPNFILFKDTSGADHVALSGQKLENVFLVRGAEGDYVRWLKAAKGPYDGFLLSTANCFGREFYQIIEDLAARRLKAAQELSGRLTACINEVFGIVTGLPHGNPFANANKAIDHFFAWGPEGGNAPPPRLHGGSSLPADVIRGTGEALSRHGLFPARGYLEG
jgi:dihydrodipicolinate synthase/N-acetylneuraminate lyase